MSIVTIVKEFWRFTKDHIKSLIIAGLIGAVLLVGFRFSMHKFLYQDKQADYNYLNNVYNQKPAYFQVIITNHDDEVFSNAALIDQYFVSNQVMEKVEERTGIEFSDFYEIEKALKLNKTNEYRGGLAGVRDSGSGSIIFRFLVGNSTEENLTIAQAYHDILVDEGLPFLNVSHIEVINGPTLDPLLDEDSVGAIAKPKSLNVYSNPGLVKNAVYAVLGFIVGVFVWGVVLLIKQTRQEKIKYALDYSWSYEDRHMIYRGDLAGLTDLMHLPSGTFKLVLSQEDKLNKKLISYSKDNLIFQTDFTDPEKSKNQVDELIILIQESVTDKTWYKKQVKLADLYKLPVTIFQVDGNE